MDLTKIKNNSKCFRFLDKDTSNICKKTAYQYFFPVFVNEAPGFSPSGVDEVIDLLLLGIHPEQDKHRPARVGRYVVQAIHGLDRFADPGQSEG